MKPHALLTSLHRLLADERRRQAADGDLLRAFVQHSEEDAFAELLRRHGPMVLRLSLHLLHHRQDAEDVFQATFLTLARKARSLRNEFSLAAWLHRVAWRLALRSRAAIRRTAGVSRLVDAGCLSQDPAEEISLRESQELLHQALAALPEHLRLPLVLCYLQGRTRDEAAHQLGWSLGTLKRRLEQGRKLLHARLSRRGVTLSTVLAASLLASAEVPVSLADSTLRLATACLAGSMTALPASVAALVEASWSVKVKAVWGLVLMLGACAGAGAWVYQGRAENSAASTEESQREHPSGADKRPKVVEPAHDLFGDPLPVGAVARLGTVRLRHADYLHGFGFTPDGKTLVSMGSDGVRVWDAATGKPVRHFGAGILPCSVALSADGRRVALSRHGGGIGSPVEIWDVATGKRLHKRGNRHYDSVCFSPDGKWVAALEGHRFFPSSPGGMWQIDIWNAATGERVGALTGEDECSRDMKFSTDGKSLLLGGGKTISVRDAATGKEVRRLGDLPAEVHSLVLSPRGDRIAFFELCRKEDQGTILWTSGTRVFLLDARTGAEQRRWTVKPVVAEDGLPRNGWWSLAFSPDGRRLAACQQHGPIRIWDTAAGAEKRLLPEGRQHSGGVAFSPDGKTLAVGEDGRSIRVIDAETGADRLPVKGHRGSVTGLAVCRKDGTVFTADEEGTIYRWNARSGHELGRLTGHKDEVDGLALSADGRTLYSAGRDRTLRLWDLKSGKDRRLLENEAFYGSHLILSPDGKILAVPFIDYKDLLLFNAATGECLHRLTTKTRIIDAAFTADGSMVQALTGDRAIWRWQLPGGRRLPDQSIPPDRDDLPLGNPDSHYGGERMAFSPDGRLAAHALDNNFLRVLDVESRREVYRTAKLPSNVTALTFAADGRTLAWGDGSGVIHWLDLAAGGERRTLPGHAGALSRLAFSIDGKRLVSASADTTALVWDLIEQGPASLSAEQRDACWIDLAGKDAAKAYRAICRLIAAPADALALLRRRLKPVEGMDEKRIEQLVAELDADTFAVREKAAEELRKIGELAEPSIRKALKSRPTLEMRRRLQELLDESNNRQWHPSAELLRQLRAVEVLEHIDTPEARKLLESLARGAAGARLTREARAAVRRLRALAAVKP